MYVPKNLPKDGILRDMQEYTQRNGLLNINCMTKHSHVNTATKFLCVVVISGTMKELTLDRSHTSVIYVPKNLQKDGISKDTLEYTQKIGRISVTCVANHLKGSVSWKTMQILHNAVPNPSTIKDGVDIVSFNQSYIDEKLFIEKPYFCNVCDKRFANASALKTHTRTHTGEKPYTCDLCSKAFGRSDNLRRHIGKHTGEKPYTCDLCNKTFRHSRNLRDHIRIHTGEKPYKCESCYRAFIKGSDLKRHLKVHTGEKVHKCTLCDQAFSHKGTLKRHSLIHTAEELYRSDLNHDAVWKRGSLTKSVMISGEKPYKCDLCEKAFSKKSYLKKHAGFHTEEKPYRCDLCSKAFRYISNIRDHIKIHTGEN